jgi:hypothetical protein
MNVPSEQVVKALKALRSDARFETVVKWFRDSLADQDAVNRVEKSDVVFRQGQGKAQNCDEFLKAVDTAPETAKRIESLPERRVQSQEQY